MKPGTGTIILVAALLAAFGIELASHSVGNEALLLKLGALPDNGELHSQYWRLATVLAPALERYASSRQCNAAALDRTNRGKSRKYC